MFEELVVYGAVFGAATYASWRLMPSALRIALAERCATLAQRMGLAEPDMEAPRRRARTTGGSGCGACTGCAGKPAPRSVAIIIKNDTKER